jgi:hypothetical protein
VAHHERACALRAVRDGQPTTTVVIATTATTAATNHEGTCPIRDGQQTTASVGEGGGKKGGAGERGGARGYPPHVREKSEDLARYLSYLPSQVYFALPVQKYKC